MEKTGRLGLPMLAGGQAGKEVTHNEALLLLDALLGGVVDVLGINAPPAEAEIGRCWILGDAPAGAWAGQPQAVACRTAGGWRFVPAGQGLELRMRESGLPVRYHDGGWRVGDIVGQRVMVEGEQVLGKRQPGIPEPAGGAAIDAEARATLGAMLAALRAHGLIAAP